MKRNLLKLMSLFSLFVAGGAISGASRIAVYQGEEPNELRKMRRF